MTGTINYALYQCGWLACILGAAWSHPWLGTAAGSATLATHIMLSCRRADELALALRVGAIGVAVESVQIASGTLSFDRGLVTAWLPPLWLVLLWMQFAGTLHFSMRWLTERRLGAVLFGAIGGPLAYFGASRLGVVGLHPSVWPSLLVLSMLWALAVPLAAEVARGFRHPDAGRYRRVA